MSGGNVSEMLQEVLDEYGVLYEDGKLVAPIDSMGFIALVVKIEEVFGIEFPDELLTFAVIEAQESLETVVVNLVEVKEDEIEERSGEFVEIS